jgi:hypothetical protein
MLLELRHIERNIASDVSPSVRHLRTRELRPLRELREACLFCYGMSQCMGKDILVAHAEAQDHDAVATFETDDVRSYAPIQIKEVVPHEASPTASVQAVVDGLTRYADSGDLTVVVHLNRVTRFSPSELVIPPLKVAALWIFGSISADQSRWALWGNFLLEWESYEFSYPTSLESPKVT